MCGGRASRWGAELVRLALLTPGPARGPGPGRGRQPDGWPEGVRAVLLGAAGTKRFGKRAVICVWVSTTRWQWGLSELRELLAFGSYNTPNDYLNGYI